MGLDGVQLRYDPSECSPRQSSWRACRTNAHTKNRTFLNNSTTMNYSGLSHDAQIEHAITDLEREKSPVIATIAKK
jgi:hypothetical protein